MRRRQAELTLVSPLNVALAFSTGGHVCTWPGPRKRQLEPRLDFGLSLARALLAAFRDGLWLARRLESLQLFILLLQAPLPRRPFVSVRLLLAVRHVPANRVAHGLGPNKMRHSYLRCHHRSALASLFIPDRGWTYMGGSGPGFCHHKIIAA